MAYWSTNEKYKLKVTWDITTYCNAGCPQCDRTNPEGLGKATWLPLVKWSFDQFKQAISPEDFKYIELCSFVGSWGDPIMNKDIFEIIEYCINNGCKVNVETNGSIRDEEWWWNLGVMGGKNLQVRFDVDGIDQEMHAKYRRFTNLQKVLDNMQTFSQTKAVTASQTVVFKHNQEYLNQIEDLCRQNGSKFHTKVISDRFIYNERAKDGVFYFINENGEEETLEEADPEVLSRPYIPGSYRQDDVKKAISIVEQNANTIPVSPEEDEVKNIKNSITKKQLVELTDCIQCRWAFPRNNVYVQHNGTLIPCCYIGWSHGRALANRPEHKSIIEKRMDNPTFNKLMQGTPDELNVFKHSIKDILTKSEWYTKTFPESLSSDDAMEMCISHCSNRIRKKHQIREDSRRDP